MALEKNTGHRSGNLKHKNKAHSHGRHRSKGQIDRDNHGQVDVKRLTQKNKAVERQIVRRNQAKQSRKLHRDKIVEKKRQRGGQHSPPHFVVVVGLSGNVDCSSVLDLLCKSVGNTGGLITKNEQGIVHLAIPRFKQRIACFLPGSDLHSILDAAKVADSLLFVTSPLDVVDHLGDYCLKCLMGQGFSNSVFVCQGLNEVPQKMRPEVKKTISREIERRFPDSKVQPLDTEPEALLVIRKLTESKTKPVHYRDLRPQIIAESIAFETENEEASDGILKVSGFLRGTDMSADRLVHVVGWGTFQIAQISSAKDPHPLILRKEKDGNASSMDVGEESVVLARPDPRHQISLTSEIEVDPMAEEQTWPTEEEIAEAEEGAKNKKKALSYQEHWLLPGDKDEDESDDDDDDDDKYKDEDMEAMEAGSDNGSWKTCSDDEDTGSVAMTETDIADDKYDVHFDMEAERLQLQQLKEERENAMFPDEVDTPMDVPARERFAKYRGLASFRTSPWHKDEDLPLDYQRIYNPGDMKHLKKRILKAELTNSVTVGQYITVLVKNVPKAYMDVYTPGTPLVLFGLLPCEQLMSVVHVAVKRDAECQETIKSKSNLIFHMGFRRFSACPIFSQLKRGDKFKMERFLPYDNMVVMTMYAPITVGSSPVLVFRENSLGEEHLVGTGSLHSVNPDRIILKRCVLSGDMFKMGKKKSVVRFMFFNREDIEYFKKVELRTKLNRRGRILEPVGTHGHMKCHFNGHAKSQDVVLMVLYKRMYPKWTYEPQVPALTAQAEEEKGQAYQMFE